MTHCRLTVPPYSSTGVCEHRTTLVSFANLASLANLVSFAKLVSFTKCAPNLVARKRQRYGPKKDELKLTQTNVTKIGENNYF